MRAGSPFLVSGVLLCLFIALVQGQGQKKLYGVSLDTSSRDNDKLYPLQTSTIGGGRIENFTTNARVQYGSFGISSIDQKQGIYYFSDGYPPAKIFATDLKNKVALPTTHLSDVDYVVDFNFDNVNNRLLLFHSRNRTATLASFQDGKLTDLWKPQFLGITNTGFDEEGQRLVMITNATGPLSFTVLDLATQQTNSFALSDECQELVFLPTGKLVWSPTQKKAYSFAFGRNPHTNQVWDTYATVIDPAAKSCEPVLIQVPFGYIMDWAIDASSDTIYFTQLINYGYLYFHYDINTQAVLYAAVLSPRLVEPLSIAVGPSYSADDNAEVSVETLSPTVTDLVGKALRNGL